MWTEQGDGHGFSAITSGLAFHLYPGNTSVRFPVNGVAAEWPDIAAG
jgi:hypothetical protein